MEPPTRRHRQEKFNSKGDDSVRKLNDQVRRLTHPMTTPCVALSAIGTAIFSPLWMLTTGTDRFRCRRAQRLPPRSSRRCRYRFCLNPQGLIPLATSSIATLMLLHCGKLPASLMGINRGRMHTQIKWAMLCLSGTHGHKA